MKIVEVRVFEKDLETSRPYTIAYKTVDEVKNVFVEIVLENGLVGIGACNPSEKVVAENVSQAFDHLSQLDFSFLEGSRIEAFAALQLEARMQL